ncbi:MAG: twin-arginine translocase TatA/TatE family subunit [Deinococcus sp.]|nr:twin-arginine translocase TatA/TatE family subunit [Deinococcus sp.]MCL5965351.1 twin-arginine translocase TatA/TatE family subunit [Deinococcus sp.]
MRLGPTELILILLVVLLLFGARKLPELARGLGQSAKEFRKGMSEEAKDAEASKENKQNPG